MSSELLLMLWNSLLETITMVGISGLLGAAIGIPVGILLYTTTPTGIHPMPVANRLIGWIVNAIRSTPVESPQNILLMTADVDVVGIDEAQFFDESIVDVCRRLANNGVRVIVAGLDMDYTGKPFGPMPALMATAEYVTKVHAICVRCGNLAHHSHRLTSDEKQVMLGAQDSYEPICRHCFNKLMNGEKA